MQNVLNNTDLRRIIWSYLVSVPVKMNNTANIIMYDQTFKKKNLFGDIFISYDDKKYKILDKYGNYINLKMSLYLEIPIKITKHIKNAIDYYSFVIKSYDFVKIFIRHDDIFIENMKLPSKYAYSYIKQFVIGEVKEFICVKFTNKSEKKFDYNNFNKEILHNYKKKMNLKKTKFFARIFKNDFNFSITLSNYEDFYDCNYSEFYKKTVDSSFYEKGFIFNIENKFICWDLNWFLYPDKLFVISFQGPFIERETVLKYIKSYDFY